MRIFFGTALLLAIAAFCVFGFGASGEAGEAAWAFRSIYGVIGLGSLGGVALIARWLRKSRPLTGLLVGTALLAWIAAFVCVFGFPLYDWLYSKRLSGSPSQRSSACLALGQAERRAIGHLGRSTG
jgi:hypothetical protein